MQLVYIILCVISVLYVFLKKRRIDFFSISVLSTIVYYYPAFWGQLYEHSTRSYYPIVSGVYVCLIVHIISLFVFMVIYDKNKYNLNSECVALTTTEEQIEMNMVIVCIAGIGLVLMFLTYVSYGGVGGEDKVELLANASRMTEYFKYFSLFLTVYAFSFPMEEKYIKFLRIVSVIMIFYTFLLGHRSFAAIGLITIVANVFMKKSDKVQLITIVAQHKRLVALAVFGALFFLFGKNVMAALFQGDYKLVWSRLTDFEYYKWSFFYSESNTILSNIQVVIESEFNYPFLNYFMCLLGLIPFLGGKILNLFNVEFFETLINEQFNASYDLGIGMGSTYLGELYTTGGVIFMIIMLVCTFGFIAALCHCRIQTKSRTIYVWCGIVLSYFSFYIHRNSLIFLLVAARAYLYILILSMIIKYTLKVIKSKKVGKNER